MNDKPTAEDFFRAMGRSELAMKKSKGINDGIDIIERIEELEKRIEELEKIVDPDYKETDLLGNVAFKKEGKK